LCRTLRRVKRITDPLACIVEALPGPFGRTLLMACDQAEGNYREEWQQGSHRATFSLGSAI
jgi:hypothetical protein